MKRAFSLIEVVVALAMLALIAVPAIGLATMAARRNQEIMTTGDASELKGRIDAAIRAAGSDVVLGAFSSTVNKIIFLASKDLNYIEILGGTISKQNDKYYVVNVRQPVGYSYASKTDSYRIVMYEVLWTPDGTNELSQLFFTSVFRK